MDQILLIFWLVVGIIMSEYVQLIVDRGSFLKSIAGRSQCDACKQELPWYALLPFIGVFLVKQKCIYCGKKVSLDYLRFELLFSATWAWVLFVLYLAFGINHLIFAVGLFAFACTSLLMYEDSKRFSVPVSWLVVGQLSLVLLWYLMGNSTIFYLDILLILGIIVLSVGLVKLLKRDENIEFGALFGSADIIAFSVAVGLLGFTRMTIILAIVAVMAMFYLLMQKRLRSGQKIPLLTLFLPLVFMSLLTL